MGVRNPTAFVNNQNTALPTAAGGEGVICTTNLMTLPYDGAIVFLFGYFTFVPGTAASNVTPRIRRGTTISGFQVSPQAAQIGGVPVVVAATQITIVLNGVDTAPGAAGNLQYVLTGQQGAATTAGAIQDAALIAVVL